VSCGVRERLARDCEKRQLAEISRLERTPCAMSRRLCQNFPERAPAF
jgi:hypothetical protein